MWAFLMNCPVKYSEDFVITKAAVKKPLSVNIPMKPQFPRTTAYPREGVETKYLGTAVPRVNHGLISVLPDSKKKRVTWKDSLIPHYKTSPQSSLLEFRPRQSRKLCPIILVIISNSNVNSAHPIEIF
jgi:hypothetical protein